MNRQTNVPRLKEEKRDIFSKVARAGLLSGHLYEGRNFNRWVIEKPVVDEIVDRMTKAKDGRVFGSTPLSSNVPAGYTYVGQMITHDIVEPVEGLKRHNFSANLDLGCMYPVLDKTWPLTNDLSQFSTLDRYGRFILGYAEGGQTGDDNDLLRENNGCRRTAADIPEPRNDENVLISQLHLFWQKLHNHAVEAMLANNGGHSQEYYYMCAKAFVTLLFQRMVLDDYLKSVLQPKIFRRIIQENKEFLAPEFLKNPAVDGHQAFVKEGAMVKVPMEFSHGAFRFGHAMIRERYQLNDPSASGISIGKLFRKGEGRPIAREHLVDWKLFFETSERGPALNTASKIGLRITEDMVHQSAPGVPSLEFRAMSRGVLRHRKDAQLSDSTQQEDVSHFAKVFKNIIWADLRASEYAPTAGDIISSIHAGHVHEYNNSKDHLRNLLKLYFSNPLVRERVSLQKTKELCNLKTKHGNPIDIENAPLWLYVLNEADQLPRDTLGEKQDSYLGPLGSLIVAEVIKLSIQGAPINVFQSHADIAAGLGELEPYYNKLLHENRNLTMSNLLELI